VRFDGFSIWQSISYWLCCCQLVVFDRDQLFGFFPMSQLATYRTSFFLPKPVCTCSHSIFNISHRAAQTSIPDTSLVIAASLFSKMRARRPNTILLRPAFWPPGRFANAIRKCKRQQNWSNYLHQSQQGNAFEGAEHQGGFV
jgi:hypothetical protein